MPGLRIMNHAAADARDGESRKRTHDGKLVNGGGSPRRDTPASNGSTPAMNGAVAAIAGPPLPTDRMAELPPEIAHADPDSYRPLSTLIQRTSQQVYNEMNSVLHAMADLQVQPQSNGAVTNGMGGHANGQQDTSETNRKKKLLMMEFAQTNRAKFIKLLVMTGWAKKYAGPIGKLIDILAWLREEAHITDNMHVRFHILREWTMGLGESNPDIRTALEILSTGKADWIPDMNFIPPEPVSPEQALKLLKYMDTALAIRLSVHETLPRHLKNWRVNSGRVTFTIAGEFEMDLISFTEDTSQQWWFIDLRLLFSPTPEILLDSKFMFFLKRHVDGVLGISGIAGAFDYLHNLIMTHKIAVLRSQAYQLLRTGSAWFGTVKVYPVHRQLVVQYWIDRPTKKNWVEIGVSTNRPKNGKISWRGPPLSSLSARWFREGVEQKDVDLKFDYTKLSMERILKRVIALHGASYLRTTRAAIPPTMTAHASLSETEPSECSLQVSLGRPDNKVTLSVEPVTGTFLLRPRTRVSADAQQYINDPRNSNIGVALTNLLAQTLDESIRRPASQLGWVPQRSINLKAVKEMAKIDALRSTMYRPSGWTMEWVLAVTIDASGETWWIWRLDSNGTKIAYVEKLALEKTGPSPPITRATLSSIERVAMQQLTFCVNKQELANLGIPNTVRFDVGIQSSSEVPTTSGNASQGWALYMRTSDLLRTKPGEEAWIDQNIRLMSQGFTSDYHKVSQIVSGTMVKSVAADMQKLMSASSQNNFIFSENGTFAILLTTPFGKPVVDELKARLRDVDRLRSFASILQKRKMSLRKSSLQAVQFQYGPDNMTATVSFKENDEILVEFGPNNPHNRIKAFLTEIINERTPFVNSVSEPSGLDRFCAALLFTRPVLVKLAALENATPSNTDNPAVHAHQVGKYRISYANPLCSFDIELKDKSEKAFWRISDNHAQAGDVRPSQERNHVRIESLKIAIASLFKGQGEGWFGVRDSIIAQTPSHVPGIENALQKLHDTVLSCRMEGGYQHKVETVVSTPKPHLQRAPTPMKIQMPPKNEEMANPQPVHRPVQPVQLSQPPTQHIPNMNPNNNNNPLSNQHNQQQQQQQQRRNFPNAGQNNGRQQNGPMKQEVIELD